MQELNYTTIRKKRKTASIRIDTYGNITVSVPMYWSDDDIKLLINKKKIWIDKALHKIEAKQALKLDIPDGHILYLGKYYKLIRKNGLGNHYIIDDMALTITSSRALNLKKFYKERAAFLIIPRVYKLANECGIKLSNVRIRNTKARLGSFSNKKALMIAERMILAPMEVIDYVIYHELAHDKHMNHSKEFYDELYRLCPDYDKNVIDMMIYL